MPNRLTFDRLFRISDPKRVERSGDVKGPPLEIDAYKDTVYYAFNFKSHLTNTTGLRHRGFIKFFRPRSRTPKPLQHLGCLVDCECPDYRYRWAWANKQRGSGQVGPRSLNQAINRAPRITNPRGVPGLCKHILAAREFIYGLLSSFPSDEPDTSEKFEKLLKHATQRWSDYGAAMASARERTAKLRDMARKRNVAGPPPQPQAAPPEEAGAPEPPELPPQMELPPPPPLEQPELAIPPEQRRRQRAWPGVSEPVSEPATPTGPSKAKGKIEPGGFSTVAQRRAARYGESQHVVSTNSGIIVMNELQEALRLVQELEDETTDLVAEPDAFSGPASDPVAAPDLPPSEPPVDDTVLGSDTEGETALDLLSQMRDALQQLATALAPPPEDSMPPEGEGMGGEGAGELPPEGGDEFGVPEPEGDPEEASSEEEDEEEEEPSNSRPVDED